MLYQYLFFKINLQKTKNKYLDDLFLYDLNNLPQNAAQSLTTNPAAITSLPLLTVPAHNGI